MLQNPTRLSGQFFPEQFTDSQFNSGVARLSQPGLIMVTDEPAEPLPTSGSARTEATVVQSTLGDSGLTTRATAPVSHGADTPQFATVNFPRLEPAYKAPPVGQTQLGIIGHVYVTKRSAENPIAAAVAFLEGENAVTFATWWQLMDILVREAGAPEEDSKTNPLLADKTGMFVYAARSQILAARIPGFMDFLAEQHTALTKGEITDRDQHARLFALVKAMGRSWDYPVTQYIPLFSILLMHGLAATNDKKEAATVIADALHEIVGERPQVPINARLDIMQRYHDAGLGDIDLTKGVSVPLQR